MTRARELIDRDRVAIVAHRGDSLVAPENTLPAFESAIQLGAPAVELDFQATRDGELVVFHDETLDRTTNAAEVLGRRDIPVDEISLDVFLQLDAGRWFGESFAGTTAPTLEAALRAILPRAVPVIEHKSGAAATCVELLRRLDAIREVVVMSFDWPFLAECRRLSDELAIVALGDVEPQERHLADAVALRSSAIGWSHDRLSADAVALIRRQPLKLWVWTVDDPQRARELVAWGANAMITNRPGVMLEEFGA